MSQPSPAGLGAVGRLRLRPVSKMDITNVWNFSWDKVPVQVVKVLPRCKKNSLDVPVITYQLQLQDIIVGGSWIGPVGGKNAIMF